jgi:hypothetical protein
VVKAVGENGGEVSRNLGRSLRDNPLAALLTGVGLAWLMAGSGRQRAEGQDWQGVERDYPRRDALPEAAGYGSSAYESSGGSAAWQDYPEQDDQAQEGGFRERVADFAGRVGEEVSGTVEGLRERASDMSHSAGARLGQAGGALRGAGGALRHQAGAARHGIAGTGSEIRHGLDTLMEEQPLVVGAIAMALGAAVGGALPRSRVEDRMFGEKSDQAMEKVRTLAQEQGAKVQATASAVVHEAVDIASEASAELGSKLPSGEEIVDAAEGKVREAASRLREASGGQASPEPGERPTSESQPSGGAGTSEPTAPRT